MGVHDLKLEFNICDPFGFKQLGVTDERGQNANLVRRIDLCADCHCQKRVATRCLSLHFATDFIGVGFRKNPAISSLYRQHPTQNPEQPR